MSDSLAMILTAERLDREARERADNEAEATLFHIPEATVEEVEATEDVKVPTDEEVDLTEAVAPELVADSMGDPDVSSDTPVEQPAEELKSVEGGGDISGLDTPDVIDDSSPGELEDANQPTTEDSVEYPEPVEPTVVANDDLRDDITPDMQYTEDAEQDPEIVEAVSEMDDAPAPEFDDSSDSADNELPTVTVDDIGDGSDSPQDQASGDLVIDDDQPVLLNDAALIEIPDASIKQEHADNTVEDRDRDQDVDAPDLDLSPFNEDTVNQVAESESAQLLATHTEGSDADDFEQPDLVGDILEPVPDSQMDHDELDLPPDTELSRVGYQGGMTLPSVHQSQLDEQSDFSSAISSNSDRQIEAQMNANEDLAQSLARELGPEFESLRASQESVVRDYVAGQQLLASIFRVR